MDYWAHAAIQKAGPFVGVGYGGVRHGSFFEGGAPEEISGAPMGVLQREEAPMKKVWVPMSRWVFQVQSYRGSIYRR